jgi:hypothetical protein
VIKASFGNPRRPLAYIVLLISASLTLASPPTIRLFRSADELAVMKIFSPDRLELNTKDGPSVCSYTIDQGSLRVVATSLGHVKILVFKMLPIGLTAPDGTILYDESHFPAARRR